MDIKNILLKEPALSVIFDEAKSMKHLPYWKKNQYWYHKLKPKVLSLVGFNSKNKDLTSCEIYDAVYFYCMNLMEL